MTTNDLLQALVRLRVETGSLACLGCGYEHNCSVRGCQILREAATQLEHFTAENAALKKEIRKAGCMFCARFEDCPEGFKPGGQEDCDNCTKKPDCACRECSGIGSSTDNWEWRGAPEEGEKA